MKHILYAAAESGPFIKTGGLGSVLESLPRQLDPDRYDVRVIIPEYECIPGEWKEKMETLMTIPVRLGWRQQQATLKQLSMNGIIYYFIGNNYYFSGPGPYGEIWLDIEKFSFFCRAVLESLSYVSWQPDLIHCHDWQSALIPVYLKSSIYSGDPFYKKIRTMLTIHNLRYQGTTDIDRLKDITGLPDEMFRYDRLEYHGGANLLKGGLSCADLISTVSKSYADEICGPEYGEGLSDLLSYRKCDLYGIVNGLDYQFYQPAKDPDIKRKYGPAGRIAAKKVNKADLQNLAGLPEGEDYFVIGIVSRLTQQKGLDLLEPIFDSLFELPVQLLILGNGQKEYEELFKKAAGRFPDQLYYNENYSDPLAKKFYAGCDAILMPSRFEPCGLSQMMALRYGSVPIVRRTGGLADTVAVYGKANKPTGFGFDQPESDQLLLCLQEAYGVFSRDRQCWDEMTLRGMRKNYSWKSSAKKYERLYEGLI